MAKEEIIASLDIGTTKICAIIAEIRENNQIEIIGIGNAPSIGVKKGIVVDLESTIAAIEHAIQEAEHMAGVTIKSVYTGIAGSHIKGLNSRGVIAVSRGDREITKDDINRVIEAAKSVAIPLDREIIHILPQEFIIDDQDGIKDPLGMSGARLEVEVHIVTAAITSISNIVKCINRSGYDIESIVLQPLASSYAVLNQDEKDFGVMLIDIGGGTTDIGIFLDSGLWHTESLGLGGNHITNDIAVGLRTPRKEAEEIKKKYGCAFSSLVKEDEMIKIPSIGEKPEREISHRILSEIIESRVAEICGFVKKELTDAGYNEKISSGAVITGGTALIKGITEIAEQILDMPVKIGIPQGIGMMVDNPIYATGIGLILYGVKNSSRKKKYSSKNDGSINKTINKIKKWWTEIF